VLTRYVLRAETFSVREMRLHTDAHDLARGSPPPLPANMSALARTTASALRAPRLAGALRGGKRCAAIETTAPRFAFPTAPGSVSFLLRPEATLDASTGARSARVVIARWESHDVRERDRDAPLSPRHRLRFAAPRPSRNAPRVEFTLAAAPRGFSVRWSLLAPLRARKGYFWNRTVFFFRL
jgi:hypothetical protein